MHFLSLLPFLALFSTLAPPSLTAAHPAQPHAVPTGFALARRHPLPPHKRQAASLAPPAAAEASGLAAPPAASEGVQAAAAGNATAGAMAAASVEGGGEASPDLTVLQLASVLEDLESTFYAEALKAFDVHKMMQAGLTELQASIIIEQVTAIQSDESKHLTALNGAIVALGGEPFSGCSFDFGKALEDPVTFLGTARTLEAVGQGAYLGAARLLTDPQLLTAAGSILTLEARHQSLLNIFNGGSYNPQPFDIALSPEGVLAAAGGFLKGCQASDLGLKANNPLTVTAADGGASFSTGTQLSFSSIDSLDTAALSCQMIVGGAPSAVVFPASSCSVPSGIDGPVAVYLTNVDTPLASNLVIQNTLEIVAGPAIIFVDIQATLLSSLFRIYGGGKGKKGGGGGGRKDFEVEVDVGGGRGGGDFSRSSLPAARPAVALEARTPGHDGGGSGVKVLGWSKRQVKWTS
ncbi:hypothetical protein JCM10207_001216 [Rhodosporidiobolus poonsookiae]